MNDRFTVCVILVTSFAGFAQAHAAPAKVSPAPVIFVANPESSRAVARVKYSLGTYVIPNPQVQGRFELSPAKKLKNVKVAFAIQGFKSNDTTLDCHLREALGLDYSKSDFPDSHVCVHDRLPEEGKNAVAFPEVKFEASAPLDLDFSQVSETETVLKVPGTWTVHGVSRADTTEIQVQKTGAGYRVFGKKSLSLKDFGVVVKKFLFISVQDAVEAEWDIQFENEEKE